jgi:hypothetical protein
MRPHSGPTKGSCRRPVVSTGLVEFSAANIVSREIRYGASCYASMDVVALTAERSSGDVAKSLPTLASNEAEACTACQTQPWRFHRRLRGTKSGISVRPGRMFTVILIPVCMSCQQRNNESNSNLFGAAMVESLLHPSSSMDEF